MDAFDLILEKQVRWSKDQGFRPDADGYLPRVTDNLFMPLSATTEAAFRGAAGNELTDRPGERAKMRALYSSSALVCNVFEYWRRNSAAIARALGIPDSRTTAVQFEAQLPTGLRGTPPTLDLLVVASDDLAWGVESKFSEPFQGKDRELFAPAYFSAGEGLWSSRGLPRCEQLARRLRSGEVAFFHLDGAQLLKHALGIRRKYHAGKLLLLWYEVDSPQGKLLAREIQAFAGSVDEALGFRAVTHREVFEHLSKEPGDHTSYVQYLRSRYFAV